jgi:hypothetical protein
MSIEEKIDTLAGAMNNLAGAMTHYATVMQNIASGNPSAIVAPTGDATAAADTAAKTPGKRGPKPKAETAPAPTEPDPFADDGDAAGSEPELTADVIRKVVLAVKAKNKDHALGLLKKIGVDTLSKIEEKDYPKVIELAAKVGVTLDDIE